MQLAESFAVVGARIPKIAQLPASGLGWLPRIVFATAALLLCGAYGEYLQRESYAVGGALFWGSLGGIVGIISHRCLQTEPSRQERLGLCVLAGVAVYITMVNQEPGGVRRFDEFLHWVTANDILEHHSLFHFNSLLPISPYFPALEIVSAGISYATGLQIVAAGQIVVGCARLIFIGAFFSVIERTSGSSRFASIATLAYMGNSSFSGFHSQFAYESLAIAFLMLVILLCVEWRALGCKGVPLGALLIIVALTTTHHVTAAIGICIVGGLCLFELLPFNETQDSATAWRAYAKLSAFAVVVFLLWISIPGNPLIQYFAPIIGNAVNAVWRLVTMSSPPRVLFQATDGETQPIAIRVFGILSYLIVAACLSYSFLAMLFVTRADPTTGRVSPTRRFLGYRNGFNVVLAGLAAMFPITVLLRLSEKSWEMGQRLGPFVFLGVAVAVAIALMMPRWYERHPRRHAVFGAAMLTCLLLGGISTGGEGVFVPSDYRAAADSRSIEHSGVEMAKWKQGLAWVWQSLRR